eukprot:g12502.t1
MSSTSRSAVAAAAGAAALFSGASFVSAPATSHLRATAAPSAVSTPSVEAASSKTASLAVAGVAVAALTASGRKAFGNIKPQLVTLNAFENELGYLSPSAGLKFADVPNGLAAISKVPAAGWGQILAYMAFCEVSQDQSPGTPAAAGDFGFKVLTSSDPAEKTKKLSAELANGRLAMMAIIGMFFQDGLTGSAWGDWANYTASPLRAFENELGVQEPVGFWDPAGFTADGSVEDFKRRRQTELKHGRISMLATMGYITPETL